MVLHKDQLKTEVRVGMRGGPGQAVMTNLCHELPKNCRVASVIHLEPGHGIGYHEHHGETELYYILTGSGVVNDNGAPVQVSAGDSIITGGGAGTTSPTPAKRRWTWWPWSSPSENKERRAHRRFFFVANLRGSWPRCDGPAASRVPARPTQPPGSCPAHTGPAGCRRSPGRRPRVRGTIRRPGGCADGCWAGNTPARCCCAAFPPCCRRPAGRARPAC